MSERILVVSDKEGDLDLFGEILGPNGFNIERISHLEQIEAIILEDSFAAILADYDLIGNRAYGWIGLIQENRSKSCLILYGEKIKAESISEILQKGAYGFVPRALLCERIYDTILDGLKNRKAFIEILGMIDELRDVNEKLKKEKKALGEKNQELDFINRLSRKVAYDLNWDRILPRILDAGLFEVMDIEFIGILYRLDTRWNLAVHLSEKDINTKALGRLKHDIVERFFSLSVERIPMREVSLHLYPSNVNVSSSSPISLSKSTVIKPFSLAGKPLGMIVLLPKNSKKLTKGHEELLSTIANILAMSLKNVQEYHKLKKMAVTDGLTGILNHKGITDSIRKEFQRSKRYKKPLSLIMIDVDNFKSINDSLGHQAGDYVLRELTVCLKRSVRKTDILARYGGDEFAILLPEAGMEKAKVLVKRLLRTIMTHAFEWGPAKITVEISYGISTTGELEKGEKEEELIHRADARLYAAKRSRNPIYSALHKA